MSKGFIKLNRKYFENYLWKEKRVYSKAEAWLDLIQSARFEATTEIIGNKVIEVQRGELPASNRFLQLRWKWSNSKVSNFVKILVNLGMIKTKNDNGTTIITLCKYNDYNGKEDNEKTKKRQQSDNKATAERQQSDEIKEYKEYKEDNADDDNAQKSKTEEISYSHIPFAKECKLDTYWINLVQLQTKHPPQPPDVFKERLWAFCQHLGTQEKKHKTLQGFKQHFTSWLRIQLQAEKQQKKDNKFKKGDV